MELETQPSNASSPYVYATPPTSPDEYTTNNTLEFYYSAPTSPRRKEQMDDDFEFETSKKFSENLEFETSDDRLGKKYWERGDSLTSMAFADELFLNGLVMPLKPPPRLLHYDTDSNSFSQKSPRTVCKIPFARKCSWNDDFDPFMVALEKVREEKRGRNSLHRRSRSYSPFRYTSRKCSSDDSPVVMEPTQIPPLSHSGPLDFKGSAYARWVRDQTSQGLSPKNPKGFRFGQRVRPLKTEQDRPASPNGKYENKIRNVKERKLKKVKGFLIKFASFRREKDNGNKQTKTRSHVWKKRLSFNFKGKDGLSSGKKRMPDDPKMAVVKYNPSFVLCLGYGARSPRKVK
ncbi:hypothetical protein CDL12_01115 [Handroanthus impetiginosus]|uniref:Uncharacterized protein n=1 Tax=Handroanthus impetiginosus TaxID=429701 RepID=A0A2G9I8Q4_9LAMI|nr:hypothetical protein CDL12_01115 [Handroanthus impetiginosus]